MTMTPTTTTITSRAIMTWTPHHITPSQFKPRPIGHKLYRRPLSRSPQHTLVSASTTTTTTTRTAPLRRHRALFSTQQQQHQPLQPPLVIPPPTTVPPASTTTTTATQIPLKPQLFLSSRELRDRATSRMWTLLKVLLVVYAGGSLALLFGTRIFFSVLRNDVNTRGITDLQAHGSASLFYRPLLHQDRSFPAHFDPNYPSLNHYNLRVLVMKEMEAAARSADGVFENSRTIVYNAQLRKELLERIIKQGWASQHELTAVYHEDQITARALNDRETIGLVENASRVSMEYEALLADHTLTEEEREKIRCDPQFQTADRIELSKQQLIYLQQGLDEFKRLSKVGFDLQELAVQLRASSSLALWRLVRRGNSGWDIRFDQLTPAYHEIAAIAAATGKLNDAIYSLTSTNLDQILAFMRNFDKNVQLINNPEQIRKNKFALPVFPKLAFEVLSSSEYLAQLATIRNQIRAIHDPLYDPANPTEILSPTGQVLNPADPTIAATNGNREFIPYVSPARLNNLPHDPDLVFLREKYNLDPTFAEELEYSQNLLKTLRDSSDLGSTFDGLKTSWSKNKIETKQRDDREEVTRAHIRELGRSASL